MKFSELNFTMGEPEKPPNHGAGPSGTQSSFVINNTNRQIDDESLGMLVEYMELDEFLDECDLRFDTNISETVTELDIDGFLSKNDRLPFEIGRPNQQQQVEALNPPEEHNKRRRVSSASISTLNSNSSHSSTSASVHSPNPVKTEFEVGLRSTGEQIFPFPQKINATPQQRQTTNTKNVTSQIILPQAPTSLTPQQTNRKQQQNWPTPIGVQSKGSPSTSTKQRKPRQKKLDPPITVITAPAISVKEKSKQLPISLISPPHPDLECFLQNENHNNTPVEANFVKPDSPVPGKNKRKRKQSISDNMKDDKYWERRRKNNAAAKRSREERLAKEALIASQANSLVLENQKLTKELKNALEENQKLMFRLKKYEPDYSP